MSTEQRNPYVGPRSFRRDEADLFHGRDREARDLNSLVASEQLVLFYAQSGAGKSSLVNTRLIPNLEAKNYEVLRVGRVSGEEKGTAEVENVFLFNLMRSLVRQEVSGKILEGLCLNDFLSGLKRNENGYFYDAVSLEENEEGSRRRRALIIDQFEELFTTHLPAWRKREGFFQQLAQAMETDPFLNVILVMREDYIASLDPYAYLLSGGLRVRYYMQRLNREAALRAVQKPATGRRPYASGVAEKLVDDLAKITYQNPDGSRDVYLGQYVEPVQLQVVCYDLWESLPPEGTEITEADLLDVGDVDQSLERFYDHRVATVAKEKNFSERTIREWFDKELITGNKTRNMVLQETESTAGLPNDVFRSLQGDLLRIELRAGQIWVELSHDRLVEPVLASNTKWFEHNLSPFQRRVILWAQQGRGENLLLGEKELAEAEKEAAALPLTKEEQEFLEASNKQIKRLQRDQLQSRRIFAALVVSLVLLVAAVIATLLAVQSSQRALISERSALTAQANAEHQKANAEQLTISLREALAIVEKQKDEAVKALAGIAGNLAIQADSRKESDNTLAILLGVKAYQTQSTLLTRTTLFNLLQYTPYTRLFGYQGSVSALAVSPDGKVIASASCKEYSVSGCKYGEITLSDAETHQPIKKLELEGEYGLVNSLAFSKSGDRVLLASAGGAPEDDKNQGNTGNKGQIILWDITDPSQPVPLVNFGEGHSQPIKTIAFNHNGAMLASGSLDKRIILWNITDPTKPSMIGEPLIGHTSFVNGLAFSQDDKTLASGGDDQNIFLWDISQRELPIAKKEHTAPVNMIAFSPDGTKFASSSNDKTVRLWTWNPTSHTLENPTKLEGHTSYVTSIAFNPEGTILASAGLDGKVFLWDTSQGEQVGLPLRAHSKAINALAFGNVIKTDNSAFPYLVSGGDDRVVVQWDLSARQVIRPLSQILRVATPSADIGTEAHSDNGMTATVINGQQIQLSNLEKPLSNEHTGAVNSLSFSPKEIDGKILLASASDDQTVILWDVTPSTSEPVFLKLEGFENPVAMAYFDGNQLITIEKNSGRKIRWNIDPANWIAGACKIVNNAQFTEAQLSEWDRLVGSDENYQITCKEIQ